jgi:hypothetical protein
MLSIKTQRKVGNLIEKAKCEKAVAQFIETIVLVATAPLGPSESMRFNVRMLIKFP